MSIINAAKTAKLAKAGAIAPNIRIIFRVL